MDTDWDSKTVIGFKKPVAKVARKDSDINGELFNPIRCDALKKEPAARRSGAVVSTDKKVAAGGNKAHQGTDHQRIAKLDRENEVAPPSKVSAIVGRAIQDARNSLQLSQKDVAQKINEKPSIIQDYESGRAIPSPQILTKLERVLTVKLRGSDIGKKLEVGKKS